MELEDAPVFPPPDFEQTLFAEVLLPVPVPKFFTYRVPLTMNPHAKIGIRAIVQFGDRKIVTGLVIQLHNRPPKEYEAKYILDFLDEFPIVFDVQLELFRWIGNYYMCTVGEVMNAALPSGLRLSSESMVQINPEFDKETSAHHFSEKETLLLNQLEDAPKSYTEISKILNVKNVYAILKSLTSKEAVLLYEEIIEKYTPKTETRIRLTKSNSSEKSIALMFESFAKKPKQEAILLKYLQEVPVFRDSTLNHQGILKSALLDGGLSASSLKTLIKNKYFESFEVTVPRFPLETTSEIKDVMLSEEQQYAQQEIFKSFDQHSNTLLHGITGSGKTEIYINLIKRALDSGAQVLYLLPEIALTTQTVTRLKKIFGSLMGVYHSRFSDNERVEVWNGTLTGRFKLIVGVRSSIFLPFDNLGLFIVDEEHDPSYKQQEPAPRYNARDVALMMGKLHHAKVLLGSATPSLESYYLAHQQKFGLVNLSRRFGEAQLPEIIIADMNRERKNKTVKGEFSKRLLTELQECLNNQEQAIIFQNRRGYSPMVNCQDCGWVPKCVNCAVSLTYHQYRHALVCHYCGYKESLPTSCPTCSSSRILTVGYGTEKLEEELQLQFPDAKIQRMDWDTTRTKTGYETIIKQFEEGQTNILVGTQMVTKGLDFDHVSVVGVFNADRMMHFPDFRAFERAYQLITQVSGRAGRREKPGKVVIQTASADHPILQFVLHNNFEQFYTREIADRHEHHYPPFTRLIEITLKNVDAKVVNTGARHFAEMLRDKVPGIMVFGPGDPMVPKIRNQYLKRILIKIYRGSGKLQDHKTNIQTVINQFSKEKEFRKVRVVVNVDP